mmetsp:Transcript_17664/g.35749  ORF Transcript_17664/g.35749 Transcript_17664/m.35749 type:complete len:307 (+) Transcript_17664:55-975(+)
MASDNSALVKLTPSSTLSFPLERGSQPRTILKVANLTNSKILFKVKTTQPTWYYVRPNQQLLAAGQVEDVAIVMVEAECNKYLDQLSQNTEEKLDKHRFLVQSRVVDDQDYNRIVALPTAQRSDEFSKLWEGPKDDRKSMKLKVEFTYNDVTKSNTEANRGTSAQRTQLPSVSENVEIVRNRLSAASDQASSSASAREEGGGNGVSATSPDAIFAELQTLRKKYDAVVEYTVHLTAERDAIVSQLETANRELTKEKTKKRGDSIGGAGSGGKNDKGSDKKVVEKGFSLFVVLIVALLCFLFGKYMS